MSITIKDRTAGSFPGAVTRHGYLPLKTNDAAVANSPSEGITGEGEIQGAPEIPSYKPYTEVPEVEGGGEECSAMTAGQGGEAGEGAIYQGDPVNKGMSVRAMPQLAAAHRHGSITSQDHAESHGAVKCGPMSEPPMNTVEDRGATMPVVATPKDQRPVSSRG